MRPSVVTKAKQFMFMDRKFRFDQDEYTLTVFLRIKVIIRTLC